MASGRVGWSTADLSLFYLERIVDRMRAAFQSHANNYGDHRGADLDRSTALSLPAVVWATLRQPVREIASLSGIRYKEDTRYHDIPGAVHLTFERGVL